jgi:phosphoserine phosphatase
MLPITIESPLLPIDAIIFDCDGTLSHIEGIDQLALENGVGDAVRQLTADAMGHSGMNPELFEKRLNLVSPSEAQVRALSHQYLQHIAPDLIPVLQIFKNLGKTLYIVSSGLYPAVSEFGKHLAIDASHIFAVEIYFKEDGHYLDFDHRSPLVYADGKRKIVQQLKQKHSQLIYVGDGLNDFAVFDLVTRFVGYGGAFYRENIATACDYYIYLPSMTPLLPLALTADEFAKLSLQQQAYFEKGLRLLQKTIDAD